MFAAFGTRTLRVVSPEATLSTALMTRSWCARCDRRRVFPPECQRRHQFGAPGDRAPSPQRSRSPCHRPGHTARRPACRPDSRGCPRASGAVADVPEDHLSSAGRAPAPNGGSAEGVRPRRRSSRIAGAARLRRVARRALSRHADNRGIPNRCCRFRRELRYRPCGARRMGMDRHLHKRADRTLAPRRPRWKTLPLIASRECTSGRAASTSLASPRRRAMRSCAGSGHRTESRSSVSSVGSRRRSTSSGSRCWRGATTCSWSSSATASTGRSSKRPYRQRFSPERCTARSSPPPTPAWTSSSIRANTKPSARPCRRRWRQACR